MTHPKLHIGMILVHCFTNFDMRNLFDYCMKELFFLLHLTVGRVLDVQVMTFYPLFCDLEVI